MRVGTAKLEAQALQNRLRGEGPPSVPKPKPLPKKKPPALNPDVPVPSGSDIFEEGSEDSSGGLLDILDNLPEAEVTDQGITRRILNMALPKHWSGRTPKLMLAETVSKLDRYAAIIFHVVSGSSRAKRSSLQIRWEGRKMGEWMMDDVACHDQIQAEQYIATVALHDLTFPVTEGFSAGASTVPGGQTFFRLLPAVFRDLWEELETKRKIKDASINRTVWAKLRTIVQLKSDLNMTVRVMQMVNSIRLTVNLGKR